MKLIDTNCPHCGASLKIDSNNKNATCDYCGYVLFFDDGIQHVQVENAENAGYLFEKGRQRAQAEERYKTNRHIPKDQKLPREKGRIWLWVLGWICIFPVPLTILLLRKNKMKPALKYGLIAVAWIVYIIIGLSGRTGDSDKTTLEQQSTIPETETTQTEEILKQEADDSIVTIENETPQEKDMDIILRSNHPTYYGSVEQSHVVWDDVENGRIHFGDEIYGYSDHPILSMEAYRNSDIIRSVFIDFTSFNDSHMVKLDEAILIAASYMPYSIMDQYYEYLGSERIVPDESRKDDSTFYIVSYCLTDEGGKAYYAHEHEYSGSIDIIIRISNDIVQSINITFGKPRWMNSLSINDYHSEEWQCDLYDYRQ